MNEHNEYTFRIVADMKGSDGVTQHFLIPPLPVVVVAEGTLPINHGTSQLIVGCTHSLKFSWKDNNEIFEYTIKVGEPKLTIDLPSV